MPAAGPMTMWLNSITLMCASGSSLCECMPPIRYRFPFSNPPYGIFVMLI